MTVYSAKAFLLYALVTYKLILCKKTSGDVDECQRCKVLTDSFNHWLDKTSRGKYEGGDAAWEEAKLKAYARSEVRLVEVQESLCSELKKHQDRCYALAEEEEQALEKWWFNEDPNSVDLYSWLCIETLRHCCPQKHFGESCNLCPLDNNNNICSGQGYCVGDGTRRGNGSCVCKRGYAGQYCENCDKNFYHAHTRCEPCHESCDGCSGEGAADCNTCKSGWQLQTDTCVDVNECTNPNTCQHNEYCINIVGSYSCKACDKSCNTCRGKGPTNCTSCVDGLELWSDVCIDEVKKNELITYAHSRIALYFGLLLITFFVFKRSTCLASLVVLITAMYFYLSQLNMEINIIDVILKIYF